MKWRPRIFMSYARENQADAKLLAESLEGLGVRVFIDTEGLLIGDKFAARLAGELEESDGLVFLHTPQSASSEWCHAEIHAASAHRLQLLRIKHGDGGKLPDPIEHVFSGLHYLEWQGQNPPDLRGSLTKAIRHARRRVLTRLTLAACAAILLVAVVALFFSRWDAWQTAQRRREILEAIESSQAPWTTVQVNSITAGLEQDGELISRVRGLRDDPHIVGLVPRLNAWQVDQLLSDAQGRRSRWDLSGVEWHGVALNRAVLTDVTMRDGRIEGFTASQCQFSDVYLGPSPGAGTPKGLSFINAKFDSCSFSNVWIDGTQLLTSEFRNGKFRGADVSVVGMAGVKFYSAAGVNVVTRDFTLFENSVIRGVAAPDPKVMDLSTPEQEVLFDGVEFVRVRFEGWFKPEWFRNSHFEACVFPASLPSDALARDGNRVD
jgi:hypothetical protein